jgi:pyridoxal phosphate enzyme (YggS family)
VTDAPLAERVERVESELSEAARSAGRARDELTLVVVTKYHPAELVRELHGLGLREFGENRHQEAREKAAELAELELRWHFVGQLQSKKARQAREYASVVHSVDRPELADRLGGEEQALDVFLQVNLTDDPARGGTAPQLVVPLAEHVVATPGLRLLGVMAVAPLDEEPARAFARLRGLGDQVRSVEPGARWMSAGMSNDFPAAIAEGATHLRIGTAITGNRPARD